MPLKIGDSQSSRTLVPYVKYNAPKNLTLDTRADESTIEWSISVSGGVTYLIRFSQNFSKKHLHTSTKKLEHVQAEYDQLGHIKDDDARWAAAQEAADEKKFHRQLAHRSLNEQRCKTCNHPISDHPGSGKCMRKTQTLGFHGQMKNGKPVKSMKENECTCTAYLAPYAEKRRDQGKPTINPLLGATAQTNDLIWLDRIPRAHFEKVIQESLRKRYNAVVPNPGWDAKGEHIEWDFGPANRGCILKFATGTRLADAKAQGHSCVEVLITLDNKDATRPIFTVCHLDGKKTK